MIFMTEKLRGRRVKKEDKALEESRGSLIRAAMRGVRLYGLDGLRIQHIGELAGMATSRIYYYFKDKDDLLRECFEQVDRQIARIFDQVIMDPQRLADDPEKEIRRLWTAYFRWLLAHPDETVFYYRYRDTPGFPDYEKARDYSHFASFIESLRLFERQYHVPTRAGAQILWLHLLSGTVMYAKFVVLGVLAGDAETEEAVFQMEMNGLRGLMSKVRAEPALESF